MIKKLLNTDVYDVIKTIAKLNGKCTAFPAFNEKTKTFSGSKGYYLNEEAKQLIDLYADRMDNPHAFKTDSIIKFFVTSSSMVAFFSFDGEIAEIVTYMNKPVQYQYISFEVEAENTYLLDLSVAVLNKKWHYDDINSLSEEDLKFNLTHSLKALSSALFIHQLITDNPDKIVVHNPSVPHSTSNQKIYPITSKSKTDLLDDIIRIVKKSDLVTWGVVGHFKTLKSSRYKNKQGSKIWVRSHTRQKRQIQ